MSFDTGLFDSLFGEKVTLEVPGHDGRIVRRTVTKKWLEQMQREGKVERLKRGLVTVHMLSPVTNYTVEHWSVGEQVSQEHYEKFKDPESGELYAMTTFREGQPELHLLQKRLWIEAKNNFG